ncbi:MAG: nuclear transport factor 2 family protein [Raineya sp.]
MYQDLIQTFYEAFAQRNANAMAACYHEEAVFNDPVFINLNSKEVKAMWKMLCEAGKDLKISFANVKITEKEGSCTWEATYTFSLTGRKVHNIIQASFVFKDGKILKHTDTFDFYKWSRQAFGLKAWLWGWTEFMQKKVQKSAKKKLGKIYL